MARRKYNRAIIDGSNVAYSAEGEIARLRDIVAVRDKLAAAGYEPIVIVDAALRHHIDDPRGYERMVNDGELRQAPAGTDADYFILSFARDMGGVVVSNDRFKDRLKSFPELRRRIVRYMVVDGDVVLERRTRTRTGA